MSKTGRMLLLLVGAVLYSLPFAISSTYRLARIALRWSVAAIKLGWSDGLARDGEK